MLSIVSIIMPSYNSERFILEAIESVRNQTYLNWELLIIDDASTDATRELVYSCPDSRVRLLPLMNNCGVANARNYGLACAKGSFIAFLDSDDVWKPDKLDRQLEFMKSRNLGFSYTAYEIMNLDGEKTSGKVHVPPLLTYKDLLKNTIIGCLTVVIDREKVGYFEMPLLPGSEDTATWLTILKKGHVAEGMEESLAYYRKGSGSLSSNRLKMIKNYWVVCRENQNLSIARVFVYFPFYLWNAGIKNLKIKWFLWKKGGV